MSTGHAILNPSGASRRWKCGGSRALEARLPDVETEEAREGTAAHEVAAHLLTTGELLPVGHITSNGVPVDEEMREGAQMYTRDVLDRLGGAEGLIVEQHVKAHELIHPLCDGTPDLVHISNERKRIRLWDYKYGHGYVEVHENPQLIEYLAGVLETYFDYATMDDQAWTFEATIVQPREYGRLGPIRRWCGYVSDLRGLFNYARDREARSMDHYAPTIAGPEQCRDCKAIATCEANQRYTAQLADYVAGNTPFDPPPSVVGAELTMLKRAEAMVKARIAGLEAVAGAQLHAGKAIPGWHYERSVTRLRWKYDPEQTIQAVKLIADKDVSKQSVITPTQAIALGVDEAVILQYAERPPGELKLVPINYTSLKKAFANG
jgi:hypothetical protein